MAAASALKRNAPIDTPKNSTKSHTIGGIPADEVDDEPHGQAHRAMPGAQPQQKGDAADQADREGGGRDEQGHGQSEEDRGDGLHVSAPGRPRGSGGCAPGSARP